MALFAFANHLLILSGIYVILALGLNLALGYTGLINLGHIAFYGVGAYTSAILALAGFPFWISMLAGAGVACAFGLLVAVPTTKLRGDYLAIATLGLIRIVEVVLKNWIPVTKGPFGITGIPKPSIFGFTFTSDTYLILVGGFVIVTFLFLRHLVKSPFGRVLASIREDEVVTMSLGKNIMKFKAQSLVISAFFAGIAGSLYAHYIGFIDPSLVTIPESVLLISMVIIGGLGSMRGSALAALLLILIPEPLRLLSLPSHMIGGVRQILYAGILILILLKRPQGLLGKRTLKNVGN